MKYVYLRKNFEEKNGRFGVSYNSFSNKSGVDYIVSKEYYSSAYEEDLKVSIDMLAKDGLVSDLYVQVNIINVKRLSKKRESIALEVKQAFIKHIENLKNRNNNVLDIEFIKNVVEFILNYNVCNQYKVVVEEEAIELKKANKVNFNKSFEVKVNGLSKTYSLTTEEIESQYGYTDLLCKMEAKSTILIDRKYALIKAYIEVFDGVVTHVNISQSRVHLQMESFLDSMTAKDISKTVNELIDDIKYQINSYIGEKDINFAYSILTMILNINSFDTNTYLINDTTYNLVDVA